MGRCIGFGEREGTCEAGALPGRHWCEECNEARRRHISARLSTIADALGPPEEGDASCHETDHETDRSG